MTEFKRMNYFKGFFTTAADWTAEQSYHREKLKLHNRGLHTPGVMKGVASELRVRATGGLNIEVLPGAAIDVDGNEIYLDAPRPLVVPANNTAAAKRIYVALSYKEGLDEEVVNNEVPEYSGFKRVTEKAELTIVESLPDKSIELARIDLQPGATAIADAVDPKSPKGNEIDRRWAEYAGSVCNPEDGLWLTQDMQERLVQLMGRTRKDFAALDARFPTPSNDDVRHAALTVEMLARIGFMRQQDIAGLIASLADIESDTGEEIGAAYPGLSRMKAFQDYMDAVDKLLSDILLTSQDEVAEAARELSEVILQLPEAEAGTAQSIAVPGEDAVVRLDGSGSRAFGGRTIARYRWNLRSSVAQPVANAGSDIVVTTNGDEVSLLVDATGSRAFGGESIAKYRWDKR